MKREMIVFDTKPKTIKMFLAMIEPKQRGNAETVACVTEQLGGTLSKAGETLYIVPSYIFW